MVTLVLPCAGTGSRLGLVYPKEVQGIAKGRIFLDNTLDMAINAGIKRVVIVTNKHKLRYFEDFIGDERNGLTIDYLINERYDSLPGSVLSGCQYEFYKNKNEKYIIGLPDTIIEDRNAYKEILRLNKYPILGVFDQPANLYDAVYTDDPGTVKHVIVKKPLREDLGAFIGTWGILGLDIDTVNRLFANLVNAIPYETGDSYLLGELIDIDCKKQKWNVKNIEGSYTDLGTWNQFAKYLNQLHNGKS